jgi:hypothetical protein
MVTTFDGPDHYVSVFYMGTPDGQEVRSMEMRGERRK